MLSADKIRFTIGFNLSEARRAVPFGGLGMLAAAFSEFTGFETATGFAVATGFAATAGLAAKPGLIVLLDRAGLVDFATLVGLAGTGFIDKIFPLDLEMSQLDGIVYKYFNCNSTIKCLIFQG